MMVIGLAGGSGSGKGTVSAFFSHYGILPIDTDKIYHDLISRDTSCTRELSDVFGKEILSETGAVDRRALSEIVFSDNEKLKELNRITHFHVLNEVRDIISDADTDDYAAVLVDAPLLFESGFNRECDAVISIIADKEKRIERIALRDNITREAAEKRIAAQLSDAFLIENSDYVIENSGSTEELKGRVAEIAAKILANKIK